MSKRNRRTDNLQSVLDKYAKSRGLELFSYNNDIHFRIIDPAFTTIDLWPTTGRYWIMDTNYNTPGIPERTDEKGFLPYGEQGTFEFLDKLFYAKDLVQEVIS